MRAARRARALQLRVAAGADVRSAVTRRDVIAAGARGLWELAPAPRRARGTIAFAVKVTRGA